MSAQIPDPVSLSERAELDRLADEFKDRWRRGEDPSPEEYAKNHLRWAKEIRDHFPLIADIERESRTRVRETRAENPEMNDRSAPNFRKVGVIKKGGLSVVFLAEQRFPKRHVALKVYDRPLSTPGERKLFRKEANTLASFFHANIVTVFAAGVIDGHGYIAMQLIDNQRPLSNESARRTMMADTLPFSPDQAADATYRENPVHGHTDDTKVAKKPGTKELAQGRRRIAEQIARVADALDFAHRTKGVLHRDIKPGNLLFDGNDVWLADFGLAVFSHEVCDVASTIARWPGGTTGYVAPERFHGQTDHRSDIYSPFDVQIKQELDGMNIFVPLVSPHFFSSWYIQNEELPRALERHANGEILVVPIRLYEMDLHERCSFLHGFPSCPTDGKPWNKFADRIAAMPLIYERLWEAFEKALKGKPAFGNARRKPRN
jgi:serine/threonine protein kinase